MAWVEKSVGDMIVYTETVTLPSGASTAVNTSALTVPYGTKLTVFANTAGLTLTADGDIDVQVSFDGTAYSTLVANLLASIQSAVFVATYDPTLTAAHGSAPYIRFQITNDGNQGAESFSFAVVSEGKN